MEKLNFHNMFNWKKSLMSSEISYCWVEQNRDGFHCFRISKPCRAVHNSNEIAFLKYRSGLQLSVVRAVPLCELKVILCTMALQNKCFIKEVTHCKELSYEGPINIKCYNL